MDEIKSESKVYPFSPLKASKTVFIFGFIYLSLLVFGIIATWMTTRYVRLDPYSYTFIELFLSQFNIIALAVSLIIGFSQTLIIYKSFLKGILSFFGLTALVSLYLIAFGGETGQYIILGIIVGIVPLTLITAMSVLFRPIAKIKTKVVKYGIIVLPFLIMGIFLTMSVSSMKEEIQNISAQDCISALNSNVKLECYKKLINQTRDILLCAEPSTYGGAECYIEVMSYLNEKQTLSDKICEDLKLRGNEYGVPWQYEPSFEESRDLNCQHALAVVRDNELLCNSIQSSSKKVECYLAIAEKRGNNGVCNYLDNQAVIEISWSNFNGTEQQWCLTRYEAFYGNK